MIYEKVLQGTINVKNPIQFAVKPNSCLDLRVF